MVYIGRFTVTHQMQGEALLVLILRFTFPNFPQSSKPLKGAWSHYPPAPSFKSFLARLRICTALLDKVSPSLHSSFGEN